MYIFSELVELHPKYKLKSGYLKYSYEVLGHKIADFAKNL